MAMNCRMRRRQRIFTFVFLVDFFQARDLPVLKLNGPLQLVAFLVLVSLGGDKLRVDGERQLHKKDNNKKIHSHKTTQPAKIFLGNFCPPKCLGLDGYELVNPKRKVMM